MVNTQREPLMAALIGLAAWIWPYINTVPELSCRGFDRNMKTWPHHSCFTLYVFRILRLYWWLLTVFVAPPRATSLTIYHRMNRHVHGDPRAEALQLFQIPDRKQKGTERLQWGLQKRSGQPSHCSLSKLSLKHTFIGEHIQILLFRNPFKKLYVFESYFMFCCRFSICPCKAL